MCHILHVLSQTMLLGPTGARNAPAEGHLPGRERNTGVSGRYFVGGIACSVISGMHYRKLHFLYSVKTQKMNVQAYRRSSLSFWLLHDPVV